MSPADAARVLGKAAAFDNRRVDAASAKAWAEALDGITLAEALAAVTTHYRQSIEWCKPAHVRSIVEQARREHAAAVIASAATLPPCRHGHPGGNLWHPRTGRPLCPLCRHELAIGTDGTDGADYAQRRAIGAGTEEPITIQAKEDRED